MGLLPENGVRITGSSISARLKVVVLVLGLGVRLGRGAVGGPGVLGAC